MKANPSPKLLRNFDPPARGGCLKTLITIDTKDGLDRAAVWQGRELIDLYVDQREAPDMTGALVCGKVVRVAEGGAKVWLDAGLAQHLYLEKAPNVRAGDKIAVRVVTTMAEDKAWICKIDKTTTPDGPLGVITQPPRVWQRAAHAYAEEGVQLLLRFGDKETYDSFDATVYPGVKAELSAKEPVHPDLDERIDALLHPVVDLKGSGSLVIEATQALTVIDVNAGAAKNALDINLRAVQEIARQIRLRNISGIIVIDALKIKDRTATSKVLNALSRACESDPAGVTVFGVTKLGLIELTRTRQGRTLAEVMGAAR